MIDRTYWLNILPVLIALAIGLFELCWARENKSRLHLWVVGILSVAAFLITCRIMWNAQVEEMRSKTDDDKWKSWMGAKMGNEDMTQKYVDIVGQFSRELMREKTGTAVDRYFAAKPEREKHRTEVEQLNAKALSRYKARFQPLYDIVVAKFDSWIEGVKKGGIDVELKVNDAAPVNAENPNTTSTIRTATFKNGDEIWLQFAPTFVEGGRIARDFHFQMQFLKGGASTGEVWAMTVGETKYIVRNQKPTKFTYKPYQGDADIPVEDKNLISAVNESLDEIMSYVVDEATRRDLQSTNQSP